MIMCIVSKMALQLFTVAAGSFILLYGVHILLEIIARNKCQTVSGTFKLFYIGWGVPALSIFVALIVLELLGYDNNCSVWCWWTPAESHFKGMVVLMGLLFLSHLGVLIASVVLLSRWRDEWRFLDRRKYLKDMAFSESMMILLSLLVIFGMIYSEEPGTEDQIVFFIFDTCLTIVIVIFLFVQQKEIRFTAQMKCHSCINALRISPKKGSFPIASHATQEENAAEVERMHAYCESKDRERYTNEHKRQLKFLLNSSSSSGSSGVGLSPNASHKEPQKRRSNIREGRQKARKLTNADSGISEGTESEKSSTTPPKDNKDEFLETEKDKKVDSQTYVNEVSKKGCSQKCKCPHFHKKKAHRVSKVSTSASLKSNSSASSSSSSSSKTQAKSDNVQPMEVSPVVINKTSGAIPKRKYKTKTNGSYPGESMAFNVGITEVPEESKDCDILIGQDEEQECQL